MKKALLPLLVVGLSAFAFAGSQSFTINFEQYAGYTQITNQYQTLADPVTFTNALQLVAPGYDYFDYPAHSGSGVITNDPNDPIMVSFGSAVQFVSGWYTDPNGITVDAYNTHGQLIGTFAGSAIVGADAQFMLSSTLGGGYISYITISDNTGQPDSETVDDLSFALPEPGELTVLLPGLLMVGALLRRKVFAPRNVVILLATVACVLSFNHVSYAANTRELITQKIDDHHLITLAGNTRPELTATNDRGEINPDLQLNHMLLLLQRSPEQEQALQQFIEAQHNPKSPSYHKWIQAAEFGQRFGLAQSDIEKITGWLESYGLKVEYVYQNQMLIDYSGTASQIESAFHIQLRNYLINGELRMANSSDPKIPAALAKAIVGPLYLNNFHPQAMHEQLHGAHINPASGTMHTDYTAGGELPLVPYDLQKIYNIAPLYPAGITGTGMTVMLVEDTNQWNCLPSNPAVPAGGGYNICAATSDWAAFRNSFGLPRYGNPVFKENNPGPTTITNCAAPSTGSGYPHLSGINSDDVEASIDVQWATAAAPNATIVNAACASPGGGFGGLLAIQNTLNRPNADGVDVISMSYGEPETTSGAVLNASFNTTFQQAVTQGLGIFVSSGDSLAAADDRNRTSATHGIQISGWMSSPYDVSVGGLDFADTYLGENSTYWNTTNNVFYGSAKSYIMEQPWNDDCAGVLLAHFESGSYITYGSTGFCNTTEGANFLEVAGGSGGPSNCATGTPATRGLVGGTCAGWAKPTYQSNYIGTMAGLTNDGVRDTPDVALMAANGLWGHYYVLCYTDTTSSGIANGGIASCTAVPPIDWPGYGGTSISSPIMAAIQSLVVQHKGSLQGNPNTRYYALANTEYGPGGNASCDSTLGNGVGSSCVFYDVTMGDIDTNCTALSGTLHNCYKTSGTYGVLSTNNSAYDPAYPTGPDAPFGSYPRGWDFSSGIGSVNAFNLVMAY